MPDLFGKKQLGRATIGGRFYATPTERVEAGAVYFPDESSLLFGVAEYTVEAGNLGAFATEGTFVFDKPSDWGDSLGRKVFFRPSTGEIVNQDQKGDVLIGFQLLANVPDDKLGVVLTQGENSVVLIVTSTADSGAGSLRAAITAASDGDVILFDSSVFPSGTTTAILLSAALVVSSNVVIDAGATESPRRVELDGQGAVNCLTINATGAATISGIAFTNGAGARGGAAYAVNAAANTFNNCSFTDCATTTNGGAISIGAASVNTLNNCVFSNCDSVNGGGVFFSYASVNTLNACTFTVCDASANGGAVYTRDTAATTLNDCTVENCTATTSGGGLYSRDTAANTLNRCDISDSSVYLAQTSTLSVDDSTLGDLYTASTAGLEIAGGVVTVATIRLNGITVTIDDGAALTITTSANTGAATFSSDGRGYLATASGVDISSATLTGVVSCVYGAGLTSFDIDADGATWTADDDTIPILIETKSDGEWTTLDAAATGGTYSASFPVGTIARAFDGVKFLEDSIVEYWRVRGFAVPANGGGGEGDDSPSWTVQDTTITPNAEG